VPTEPTIEDLANNLTPLTKAEVEPMLLLDTSGSMTWPAADGSKVSKEQVVGEAIGAIVRALEAQDSQAEKERAGGADEAEIGGLYTIGFADGPADYEDLNSANLAQKWAGIQWGGATHIVAGWDALTDQYTEEFGDVPKQDRPHLLALIITDGEAQDGAQFAKTLEAQGGHTYVVVAVVGFGSDHDATLAQYRAIEAHNKNVRVITFDSVTDPATISNSVLALIGE
jgi:uncharacterized protein YegL